MTEVEPLIRSQLGSLMPLPDGSRSDWADVLERSGHRQRHSRLRLLLAVAVALGLLAVTGATIAAAVGVFSGERTMANFAACKASTVALTTPSGARVLTGRTDAGIYCVTYEDANGGGGSTTNTFPTPAGDVVPLKTKGVVVGLVPTGYDTLTLGSVQIPIANQVFVIDPKLATKPGTLSGPAGTTTINLRDFATP
jgi:hypothetical protein